MKVYKLRRSLVENAQRADLSTVILKHNDTLHLLTRHPTGTVSDAWLRSSRYRAVTAAAGEAWQTVTDAGIGEVTVQYASMSDSGRRTWTIQIKSSRWHMCS
jgi:hypothetical protein